MNAWRRLALVYVLLLLVSMAMTRFQITPPLAVTSGILPLTQLVGGAADNVRSAYDTLVEERDLARRYRALRSQNDVLRGRLSVLERENARLKEAAQIRATQSPSLVTVASVVAVDPSPLLSRLTVNKGIRDGVGLRMPATVPAGLVGQVTSVDGTSASVTTILDPESRVGVSLAREGWRGGRGLALGYSPERLKAEFPLSVDVRVGDVVETSNLGGVYPSGIRVGTVEEILPLGSNDVRRSVIIKPAADITTLEEIALLRAL